VQPVGRMGFEGWFDIKLIHAATGHVKQHLRFKNLIVDAGLNGLGNTDLLTLVSTMQMGTGTTAPAAGQTNLIAPIGTAIGVSYIGGGSGPSFDYWYGRTQGTFLEPNANGTLTEIGIFGGGVMWARQLLKDAGGTPTAIVKTASDQLQVTYEWRLYHPTTGDQTGNVTISGSVYAYVVRVAAIGDTASWGTGPASNGPVLYFNGARVTQAVAYETDILGSISGIPAGPGNGDSSRSAFAYVSGSYQRDKQYVFELANANFTTGIGSMLVGGGDNYGGGRPYQVSFTPKLPKTSTKRLTMNFTTSWGRYP
jgi:hypothetical protein